MSHQGLISVFVEMGTSDHVLHPVLFIDFREDYNQHCESLISDIHDMERNVNSLVIRLIVSTFKETTEPLDRLIKAALSNSRVSLGY